MFTTQWSRSVTVAMGIGLVVGVTSCASPHQYVETVCSKMRGDTVVDRELAIQCQTFKQAEAATAAYNEASLLVKSYRACLGKYEQTPDKANEHCAEYPRALANVACTKVAGEYALGHEVGASCESSRQEEAATAVYNEAMLLVRSYRSCLEKYEQVPSKSREYCGEYPKAINAIGLKIKEAPDSAMKDTAAVSEPGSVRR